MNVNKIKDLHKGLQSVQASQRGRLEDALNTLEKQRSEGKSLDYYWLKQSLKMAHDASERVALLGCILDRLSKLAELVEQGKETGVTCDALFDLFARYEARPDGTPDYGYAFRSMMSLT